MCFERMCTSDGATTAQLPAACLDDKQTRLRLP